MFDEQTSALAAHNGDWERTRPACSVPAPPPDTLSFYPLDASINLKSSLNQAESSRIKAKSTLPAKKIQRAQGRQKLSKYWANPQKTP